MVVDGKTYAEVNDQGLPFAQARALGVEAVALKAVHEVECRGSGFNADNTPVILFERHVMRQRLIANGQSKIVDVMMAKCPDLCSKMSGGYGLYSAQHVRLAAAAEYHRKSALESCPARQRNCKFQQHCWCRAIKLLHCKQGSWEGFTHATLKTLRSMRNAPVK